MNWTDDKLKALPSVERADLRVNAAKSRAPGAAALVLQIDALSLPMSTGGLSQDDPLYAEMERVIWSAEVKAAALQAVAQGLPALAGVAPRRLVVKAPSIVMNPSLPQAEIDQAYADDPARAAAEYGTEFRQDIEAYVARDVLERFVTVGVAERSPEPSRRYTAFVDMSGGSSDSAALAIAHQDGVRVVPGAVRERKAPHSPESVATEFAELLKRCGLSEVTGDASPRPRHQGQEPQHHRRGRRPHGTRDAERATDQDGGVRAMPEQSDVEVTARIVFKAMGRAVKRHPMTPLQMLGALGAAGAFVTATVMPECDETGDALAVA